MDFLRRCQPRPEDFPRRLWEASGSPRQRNGEDEVPSRAFFGTDGPAVTLHDMLADGQSEAGGRRGEPFFFHTVEAFENALYVLFRHARACIGDREFSHGIGNRPAGDGENAALGRVAAGVFQKIAENLRDIMGVGMDVHASVHLNIRFQPTFFEKRQAGVQGVVQYEGRTHTGRLERDSAGFQPRKMEHIVDEQGHVAGVAQDDAGEFLPVFHVMRRKVEHGLCESDDRGERGPQFVRDLAHEFPAAVVQADKVADIVEDCHGARCTRLLAFLLERCDAYIEYRVFPQCDAEGRRRMLAGLGVLLEGRQLFSEGIVGYHVRSFQAHGAGREKAAEGRVGLKYDALSVQNEYAVVQTVEDIFQRHGILPGAERKRRLVYREVGEAGFAVRGDRRLFHG